MLILITGGSKNGKSAIAEQIFTGERYHAIEKRYLATMEPYGAEAAEAIERHQNMRKGKGFLTIEKHTAIHEVTVPQGCGILLECLGNLCANEMFTVSMAGTAERILEGIDVLMQQAALLVIVSSQVGDDGIGYPAETMAYIENMGLLNAAIAEKADCVIEAVYGIPVIRKGEMPI